MPFRHKILLTSTDVYHSLFAGPGLALCWLTSFHFDCSNTVFLTRIFFYFRIESNMAAVTLTHGKSIVTCTRWLWYRCNIKSMSGSRLSDRLRFRLLSPTHTTKKGTEQKRKGSTLCQILKYTPTPGPCTPTYSGANFCFQYALMAGGYYLKFFL